MSTSTNGPASLDLGRQDVAVDTVQVDMPVAAVQPSSATVEASGVLHVVPDGFYIPREGQQAPGWLIGLIDGIVQKRLGNVADFEAVTAQVQVLLGQLEELKEVYEQQEQIEALVAAQVNGLISPVQNAVGSLAQRVLTVENNTVGMTEVEVAISQQLDVVTTLIDVNQGVLDSRVEAVEARMLNVEEGRGDITHFTGILEIESEGLDSETFNDDRMDITNEVIQVYSGRDIVLQIGDLTIPTLTEDTFNNPTEDDFDDDYDEDDFDLGP